MKKALIQVLVYDFIADIDDDIILLEELQAPGIDGCVVGEAWQSHKVELWQRVRT